jgi:DNA (cytosine-5)-methyltransferase 1
MRIVSLFSGAGGLDLGFIQAGHRIVWANDIDEDAVATYKKNLGEHIVLGDIKKIGSDEIPDCDMVIGGFPCQGFSVANTKRHEKDERNKLYIELLRVIKDKKPRYFLAENVKGLLSLANGKVLSLILSDFEKAGYGVRYRVLDAADYGVPQHRYRVVIIGVRKDLKHNIDFPRQTHTGAKSTLSHSLKPWITVRKALEKIPEPGAANKLHNHTYSRYKLTFNGYLGHRPVSPDKPAPTVTARGDDKGGVVVLPHPNSQRRMSARELAFIQSFPLDYVFYGSQSSVYRQIGNAVPPLLAKAIAAEFPKKEANS